MGFTVPLGSLPRAMSSYPTFSPLPSKEGRLFSAALAVKAPHKRPARVYRTLKIRCGIVPCGVRTFLYWQNQQRSPAPLKPVGE